VPGHLHAKSAVRMALFVRWHMKDAASYVLHSCKFSANALPGSCLTCMLCCRPQVFMMHPPIDCAPKDDLAVDIKVARREDNHRLLAVEMDVTVTGSSAYAQGEGSVGTRKLKWNVD